MNTIDSAHCSAKGTGNYYPSTVHEVRVVGGQIEITYRAKPSFAYLGLGSGSPPDLVWKEIWRGGDGTLVRLPDVQGVHVPSAIIQEAINFPT